MSSSVNKPIDTSLWEGMSVAAPSGSRNTLKNPGHYFVTVLGAEVKQSWDRSTFVLVRFAIKNVLSDFGGEHPQGQEVSWVQKKSWGALFLSNVKAFLMALYPEKSQEEIDERFTAEAFSKSENLAGKNLVVVVEKVTTKKGDDFGKSIFHNPEEYAEKFTSE